MYDDLGSSIDDEGGVSLPSETMKSSTRKSMSSLFAQDAMQSKQGVTSLRYGNQSRENKAVSLSAMRGNSAPGYPPNAPSPLQTAVQAVTLAYRGETSVGACVVAVCVPHANAPIATPLIAIVDREKRPQCRVTVDRNLQFIQNGSSPQYAFLYDPSLGSHWTLMFKGRRECTEFSSALYTTLHYMEMSIGTVPPFVEWSNETKVEGGEPQLEASRGGVVAISYMAWLLRRVPGTSFFSLGKMVEDVSPLAPCEVVVGGGNLMAGIEEALIGMQKGTSRLVFVPPKKTDVRMGMGNPEVSPTDTVVVHLTCHDVMTRFGMNHGSKPIMVTPTENIPPDSGTQATSTTSVTQVEASSTRVANAPVAVAGDISTVLQAILLQMQQQQQQQQKNAGSTNNSTGCGFGNDVSGPWSLVERSIDRIYMQLSSLYEKVDRFPIADIINKNNAAIEQIMKRVVGKAPTDGMDVEDMPKDRDELLATIERLKRRLEEETSNYHRALEAMGRHKDEVHHLQNDLRIEQETHASRVRHLEEHHRLKFVEVEVRHRQALEQAAKEKLLEGREMGFKEGLQLGKLEATDASGGHSNREWRDRLFASEQRVVELETEMQEQASQHISERSRLQEQIDTLHELTAKLDMRAQHAGVAFQHGADETLRQCKRLRRAMNAAYAKIEIQLFGLDQEKVEVKDVLQMVMVALRSEADAFIDEIKKEAALWVGVGSHSETPIEITTSAVKSEETFPDQVTPTETEAAKEEDDAALLDRKQDPSMNTRQAENKSVQLDGLPPVPLPPLTLGMVSSTCDNPPNVFSENEEPAVRGDESGPNVASEDEEDNMNACKGVVVAGCLPKPASNIGNKD
ncbi:peptidyl-prolyl isomerase E (cyclophilin E) [Trypanosoma rangeli]|uniref:peptidylprolyl isomerase n=1 Tax=Trypanosoma rangeli TaxID=5698 RepID=A0A3R7MWU5_TRYRA|nr:peptidyl-prolyl isomerase E (cyclophilin E) [Trypanosoma rangeli]RNF12522.1 peptidyl-prolyl isomerase E (cyclophilin E) [Trypanosoma rangeli]|eukprot:RNF12522.1 peptidyl-prolyl isomerase E (cyclophilin E) [Trypanosoma rangeli]